MTHTETKARIIWSFVEESSFGGRNTSVDRQFIWTC